MRFFVETSTERGTDKRLNGARKARTPHFAACRSEGMIRSSSLSRASKYALWVTVPAFPSPDIRARIIFPHKPDLVMGKHYLRAEQNL